MRLTCSDFQGLLQGPLGLSDEEIRCDGPGHNAASHDFVSNFASRPVADRTCFWLLASHRDHLAGLLSRDLGWSSWAWNILKSFSDQQFTQRDCLQPDLAPTPGMSHVNTDLEFSGNLRVPFSFCCCQHDLCPFCPFLGV